MKRMFSVLGALAVLGLSGCLPEERFWWSPDGTHALVSREDGLYLAQADGIAPVKIPVDINRGSDAASQISWLPDGSGFVLNRVLTFSKWEDAKAVLPAEEAGEVERLAKSIPLLVAAWNAAHAQGGESDSSDVTDWLSIKDKEILGVAIFHAHATQRDTLEAELLKSPKGREVVEGLRDEEVSYFVHEISVVKLKDGKVEGEPRSLARSLRGLVHPKVSPAGKMVAFHHIEPEGDSAKLVVTMVDGSVRLDVAHETSGTFDWTVDGRALVYTAPVMSKENNMLQRIQRIEVTRADGSLKSPHSGGEGKNPDELQGPENLALALTPTSPRVVALPDGRVLFASQPVTFPATGEGLEVAPLLFTVTADGKTLSPVPTAPGDLPANLGWFTASPDGRKVAVVESDTDAVAVVEIESGKTEIISPVHADWQCRTMPAWKSPTELTFAALKNGAPKWMLWKQGEGVRSISDSWPAEATKEWLEEKKKEQPAEKSP